jgi:murein DD-endopeptidase MepM/ murein hydrolase activator NlpD
VRAQDRFRHLMQVLRSRLGLRTRVRRFVRRGGPLWKGTLESRVQTYFGEPEDVHQREQKISSIIRTLHEDSPIGDVPTTWAWPVSGRVTSPFGERFGRMHFGADIAAVRGTPIRAGASGYVLFAGPLGEYGTTTVIGHGGGVVTLYAHQDSSSIDVGDHVACGDIVGRVGTSGRSTGPHLHFETRTNGTPEDPLEFYSRVQRLDGQWGMPNG